MKPCGTPEQMILSTGRVGIGGALDPSITQKEAKGLRRQVNII